MTLWTVPGFTEVRQLGRGASGRVVMAHDDATGTPVAVKYLNADLCADDEFLRRFRGEARLLAEVDSPHIAGLYEYIEADLTTPAAGTAPAGAAPAGAAPAAGAAIVMELVEGVSLRTMLREHGPVAPEAALCVLKGSLLGLAAAHAHGVVHRDYKPENVLVDTAGGSKLADFGIATRAGHEVPIEGTPAYMAPEQWAGAPASPTTDIYAATATFFECLTGRAPYAGAEDLVMLRAQHANAPIPLGEVPGSVRDLVRDGLAKETGVRPAEAEAFLVRLEASAAAGYGADWERRGRGSLARRVALLALLLPGAIGGLGSSAFAATALGPGELGNGGPGGNGAGDGGGGAAGGDGSGVAGGAGAGAGGAAGSGPLAHAGVGTLAGALTLAACLGLLTPTLLPDEASDVSSPASAAVVITPSAPVEPTLSPTPVADPTPAQSPSSSAAPPPPPPPAPPPPPSSPPPPVFAVNSIVVTSLRQVGDNVEAVVTITTTTTDAFTLSVRFAAADGSTEIRGIPPVIKELQLCCATSYSPTVTMTEAFCAPPHVKATATAGGVTSAAVFTRYVMVC